MSYWEAKSETISILASSCSVAWSKPYAAQHEWIKIAKAHAECHFEEHPKANTSTDTNTNILASSTAFASTSTPTNSLAIAARGQAMETIAFMSTGIALLANVA